MTKKENVIKILQNMGLKPDVDEDGDVWIRYQMKFVYVQIQEPDDQYYRVLLPNLYQVDDGEETMVLVACNRVTREVKCLKTFIIDNFQSVNASFEFYATEETLADLLEKALSTLSRGVRLFYTVMSEIESLKDS